MKRNIFLLLLLIIIGAFLHFYNLNWGAPYYFNPDERNIANAVSQLHFKNQMNPHFFAYGSLPIYAIYFSGVLSNYLMRFVTPASPAAIFTVQFGQAVILSRFFSALFATLLIPILYMLGKKLKNETAGLLAAFLTTASTGFIQFAHFGTFEMWLTFFSILLFSLCLQHLKKPHFVTFVLLGIVFGILVSVKVSSLVLFPIPIILFIGKQFGHHKKGLGTREQGIKKAVIRNLLFVIRSCKDLLLFALIGIIVYLLTNPYAIIDQKDLLSSMNYESSVAIGTEPVFYTQNFANTTPGIYQFLHVYPFLLNPLITLLFILAFFYLLSIMIKYKNKQHLLLVTFYLILIFSQAFLFVKWTRYMMPTLPFIYLVLAIVIARDPASPETKQAQKRLPRTLQSLLTTGTIIICIVFAFSYFKTAFLSLDSRIAAVQFATKIIPSDAKILSEPSDLGALPFQDAFSNFDTFSFYDMDNPDTDATEGLLRQKLINSQYIVILSQRVLQSRIENPKQFPKSNKFYQTLISNHLGFQKIYETPCDIFCKITYLGDPVYWWEQTVSVFDHPTVFIFKKIS